MPSKTPNIDQAARRAFAKLDSLLHDGGFDWSAESVVPIIAAEFAPLQQRLNAIADIPDPEKFVETANTLRNAVRCEEHNEVHPRCDGVNPKKSCYGQCETCRFAGQFDKTLAAKPKEKR